MRPESPAPPRDAWSTRPRLAGRRPPERPPLSLRVSVPFDDGAPRPPIPLPGGAPPRRAAHDDAGSSPAGVRVTVPARARRRRRRRVPRREPLLGGRPAGRDPRRAARWPTATRLALLDGGARPSPCPGGPAEAAAPTAAAAAWWCGRRPADRLEGPVERWYRRVRPGRAGARARAAVAAGLGREVARGRGARPALALGELHDRRGACRSPGACCSRPRHVLDYVVAHEVCHLRAARPLPRLLAAARGGAARARRRAALAARERRAPAARTAWRWSGRLSPA